MTFKTLLYSAILSIGHGNVAWRTVDANQYLAMGSFTSQALEPDHPSYELMMPIRDRGAVSLHRQFALIALS
jgi:hypothetical protein